MTTPLITETSFSCPHCLAFAHQRWFELNAVAIAGLPVLRDNMGEEWDVNSYSHACDDPEQYWMLPVTISSSKANTSSKVESLHLSECFACKKLAVWVEDRLVYPKDKTGEDPNPDLPEEISKIYEEARTIVDLSPRSAAGLLRLCIEKLCRFLGEEGDLNSMIGSLVSKGLPEQIQRALDSVRLIGNDAVHPESATDWDQNPDISQRLFSLVNVICQERISRKKAIDKIYLGLPKTKLNAIADRNKPRQ